MAIPKNAKSKRAEAERAAEWYCHEILGCIETRRAVQQKFHKVDFFGADVMGYRELGSKCWVQVTAGGHAAVTARRRKLEKHRWHHSETVQLLQLIQSQDPANARRKLWFFRVHNLSCQMSFLGNEYASENWITEKKAIPIPRKWFKKYK